MATIAENLLALRGAKEDLADNLTAMGVTAVESEPFDDLVGKVLDIESGGATLNLHCQEDEPEEASGLWIKKDFTPASTVIAASRFFNDPLTDDTWGSRANLTTARDNLCAGVVNGIIYVIGGTTGPVSDKNEAYDPTSDTWATKANLPTARTELCAGVVNGIVYVIGGYTTSRSDKNEAYDPTSDTWSTKANLPTGRSVLCAGVIGNTIYCIGGMGGTNKNEAYSPIGSTVVENALVIDCSVGTNQVDLIDVEGIRLTVPVTSVGVGDAAGLLKKTASAWHNGTAWTDIT